MQRLVVAVNEPTSPFGFQHAPQVFGIGLLLLRCPELPLEIGNPSSQKLRVILLRLLDRCRKAFAHLI